MKQKRIPRSEGIGGLSWAVQPWLGDETLLALAELNEQCLTLLTEQAAVATVAPVHPLLRDLGQLWGGLDAAALKRAAACPYLLMDVGFADPHRWRWAHGQHVRDRDPGPTATFFSVSSALGVMRLVLTYGWHLARSRPSAARLLLGMSTQCVQLVAECSLREVTELAERYPAWLRPRWPHQLRVWRELLLAAVTNETSALEQARMRGLQILAAESRVSAAN